MAHYNSFVVRIWSGDSGDVRGEVVHVATQERRRFLTWDRMEEFIMAHLSPVDALKGDEGAREAGLLSFWSQHDDIPERHPGA